MGNNKYAYILKALAITASYFVAGSLGLKLAFVNASATAIWPPTGIAIAIFLLSGYRFAPAIFAGAFLVNTVTAGTVLTSLAIAFGNTLEGLIGAYLVNTFAEGRRMLGRAKNIFLFVFLVGLSATVSATIGITSLALAGFVDWLNYASVWFTWWLGDMGGAIIVAPFILAWAKPLRLYWKFKQTLEALVLLAALILASVFIFIRLPFFQTINPPVGYIAIPVILWVAVRFGQREAASASLIISAFALWGTLRGYGPFGGFNQNISLLLLQAYIATITILALMVNAIVSELRESKENAMALLKSVGDGIIATDREGKITLVNKAFEELLGWHPADAIGKYFNAIIAIEALESGKENYIKEKDLPLNLAIATGQKITGVYYLIRHDHSKFPAALTATPIIVKGKVIGAIKVIRDISEEIKIDRAKSEFIALASHQLRTPLSIIGWYVEALLKKFKTVDRETEELYLNRIFQANRRMIALADSLLNVSRIELGIFAVEPEPTDVVQAMEVALDECAKDIQEKNLTVKKYYDKDLPAINLDQDLTKIIITNILSNAAKYTPKNGSINLDVLLKTADNNILIRISDTGYGIPKNQQGEIFLKLFRADNIKVMDTDGSGIGLYLVKLILEHAGGKIWFESEENKGSTFFVTIPLSGMQKKIGSKKLSL